MDVRELPVGQASSDLERTEVGSYFVANYPPFSLWRKDGVSLARDALAAPPRPGTPLGLYLHIPFCRKRCKFCYFRVYTDRNAREIERYLSAMEREVELLAQLESVRSRLLRFVYFGGGTPSYLSEKQLSGLFEKLQAVKSWSGAEEVTFECEPGTLTERKLRLIRERGVTRLSLGVENFDDGILEENGRAHRSPEVFRAYEWARASGFPQINIDLIAGMVGETPENWRACIERVKALAPESVTIYPMELPFNAVYAGQVAGGTLSVADWTTKREWIAWAFEELERDGYRIASAYTAVRSPSTHFVYRDALWNGADMLGTGVASFSHVGGVHYQNLDGIEEYMAAIERGELPLGRALRPTERQLLIRSFILQLKLGRVDPRELASRFGGVRVDEEFRPILDGLRAEGYLQPSEDAIELSRSGLLCVDTLLPRFFEPEHRGVRYT